MSAECVAESIPAGYKQTEVGVIPEDWSIKRFGEIAAPRNKRVDPRKDGCHDFCVELEHIASSTGFLLGHTSTSEQSSIKTIFQEDDVLFGKLRAYLRKYWHASCSGVCSTEIWVLTPLKDNIDGNYLFQTVQTDKFIEAASSTYGTHMPRSDWNVVKNYILALPPTLAEQEAIATALSDTDALIESLEQLIAMKCQIKQGAMQELLTGKRRLPGFSGEWEMKLLNEVIASCSSGATPYRGRPDYYKGKVKWITSGELNYNLITDTLEHISEEAVEHTNLKIHPIGTFLMAITGLEAAGTRGACGIVGSPATTNQSCMAVYPTSELKTEYLYHYYVFRGNELALQYCQGTKQQSYTAKLVKLLPINLPPTLEEQNAIATILSDMDAGIALLEEKLKKSRMFKQGMMQELLTGRIRLV